MSDVWINGKLHRLSPAKSIGKGGEADVYDIGGGHVAKLYKQPDHPDYDGLPAEQAAAAARLATHQAKLPAFPRGLPTRVVAPVDLVTNKAGNKILGFTMPFLRDTKLLLRYSERAFRSAGVDSNAVTRVFRDLHGTVSGVHKAGVVIGDFNDLNVLVSTSEEAFIIDADSFQFGRFPCQVFTARFVDPILCDPKGSNMELVRPHGAMSDWYAYNVMLFQCLLFVGPYGGVYKPKNQARRVAHDARPLHRITVFDPEVKYPKPAVHFSVLSDDLLEHFHRVFEKDERREFPAHLLEMQWATCPKCGIEFSRPSCPTCSTPMPGMVKETTVVRGTVTCTTVFKTKGRILFAALQGGKLLHLWHEGGKFRREGDRVVLTGDVDSHMRFRIRGQDTLIARDGTLVTLVDERTQDHLTVDRYEQVPVFDANERGRFWLSAGKLLMDQRVKTPGWSSGELVGDVLEGQTMFWVGEQLGFGFYRAGKLSVAFVFRAGSPGINDKVKIPPITGQLIDSTCYFGKDRVWFATATQEGGTIKHRVVALKGDGTIEATTEATAGDGSWLGTLRGKAAAGAWLFASTDDGIVRLEVQGGRIAVTKTFPDTEPFVDAGCHLFPGPQGLYVVTPQEIRLLEIR